MKVARSEFELYDIMTLSQKIKYLHECSDNNIRESEKYKPYKSWTDTEWDKLLKLRDSAQVKFITSGIPIIFDKRKDLNMQSGNDQNVKVLRGFLDFYLKDCEGEINHPDMVYFFWELGHEIAHKQADAGYNLLLGERDILREVYCDIQAIVNAGLSRDDIDRLESVVKKLKKKNYNKYQLGHPTWERRIHFIKEGVFNDQTIDEIIKCEKTRRELKEYYYQYYIQNAYIRAEEERKKYELLKERLAEIQSEHMYVTRDYSRIDIHKSGVDIEIMNILCDIAD